MTINNFGEWTTRLTPIYALMACFLYNYIMIYRDCRLFWKSTWTDFYGFVNSENIVGYAILETFIPIILLHFFVIRVSSLLCATVYVPWTLLSVVIHTTQQPYTRDMYIRNKICRITAARCAHCYVFRTVWNKSFVLYSPVGHRPAWSSRGVNAVWK